jgi:hypothetical protein
LSSQALSIVIPAKAGIHRPTFAKVAEWIPTFVGMTAQHIEPIVD